MSAALWLIALVLYVFGSFLLDGLPAFVLSIVALALALVPFRIICAVSRVPYNKSLQRTRENAGR